MDPRRRTAARAALRRDRSLELERRGPDLAAVLDAWGRAERRAGRRDLPWRATRDPWAVLVSEVMLQQTQAARVAPIWRAWMARWPDAAATDAAPLAEVIGAWGGLGYNRRALALHRSAAAVVDRHAGAVPDDLTALRALPGIGAYTARAILAFAFERDVGVVDVNASRVIARALAGRPVATAEAQRLADALVPPGGGWAHNSAILDLGATVCLARRPRCGSCPLAARGLCAWVAGGEGADAGPDPAGVRRAPSPWAGSDRQGRGRIVAALRRGPIPPGQLAVVAGWPDDQARAARIAAGLVADGLAGHEGDGGLGWPPTTDADLPARVPSVAYQPGPRRPTPAVAATDRQPK